MDFAAFGNIDASAAPDTVRRSGTRAVRAWLLALAALVVLMVGVGGATRLTGSGLSITEWKPVTGAVPPVSDAAWAAEFEKYRGSAQYENLNRGMALAEFKTIYWWEWSHRQLGRAIGLAFGVPFLVFWWKGILRGRLALTVLLAGLLGGLQATVGWIMVASGLEPGMTAVAPLKLTAHLTLAALILTLLVWTASGLRPGKARADDTPAWVARAGKLFVGLVLAQIALGGLVAGTRAGLTYNTWPLMDGRLVPPAETLFAALPWFENFVDNPALVQFQHRLAGYAVVGLALWTAWRLRNQASGSRTAARATGLAGLALCQMALGIVTLLLAVPLWAGLAHQLLAMGLLAMAVVHARIAQDETAISRP